MSIFIFIGVIGVVNCFPVEICWRFFHFGLECFQPIGTKKNKNKFNLNRPNISQQEKECRRKRKQRSNLPEERRLRFKNMTVIGKG